MIVVCPNCAAQQDLPEADFKRDGMMACAACGHRWIESRGIRIIEPIEARYSHEVIEAEDILVEEREVRRLTHAARRAEVEHAAARLRRRKELRGWAVLAGAIMAVPLVALAVPEQVAGAFPPAQGLYDLLGMEVNASGLEFRNVGQQHGKVDGVSVLSIQGEIVNVSKQERSIPVLAFYLKDEQNKSVYDWRLVATTRAVKPGEVSNFVTRIAAPPESARNVEIRFAPPGETGSNTGHDNGQN